MGWFSRKKKEEDLEEKLNPSQDIIAQLEGAQSSREPIYNYRKQYEEIEIVNRAVNMIVDAAGAIPYEVGTKLNGITPVVQNIRQKKIKNLLNFEPNPFQDANTFKRNLIIDLLIDGNIFIYFDGAHLYHLPADKVTIIPDTKNYIKQFEMGNKMYYPDEIIHIKENSFFSIYRGVSRLRAAKRSMEILSSMRAFQDNFFKNGAVPGLVLKTPNTLSEKIKERLIASWMLKYNPNTGGRRPLILDGGLEVESISDTKFKDLDFQEATGNIEKTILKAIGVPPILLDGGNQATIAPNHRLFYLETVVPIIQKFNSAFTRFFGYEVWEDTTDTLGLRPSMREQASYFSTLVNGGIISPNEARIELGKESMEGHDEIRVPANIAGSARNPSDGGRPENETDDED